MMNDKLDKRHWDKFIFIIIMYSETPNRIKLAKCADINQTRPNMKIL